MTGQILSSKDLHCKSVRVRIVANWSSTRIFQIVLEMIWKMEFFEKYAFKTSLCWTYRQCNRMISYLAVHWFLVFGIVTLFIFTRLYKPVLYPSSKIFVSLQSCVFSFIYLVHYSVFLILVLLILDSVLLVLDLVLLVLDSVLLVLDLVLLILESCI